MEFQLLGPMEAVVDGQRCDLGPAKQRLALAILLLAKGQPVTADELIDKVWEENPPPTVRALLYGTISRLRRCLDDGEPGAADMLTTYSGGYQAQAASEQVDLYRFWDLRDRAYAHVEHDRTVAAQLLRQALDQGAGGTGRLRSQVPLADLSGRWVESTRVALQRQYRDALVAYLEIELQLGNHSRLVSTLTELADDHPTDEQLAGLLMLANYRAGSPASALKVFERIRQRVRDDLGADPSKELKALHHQVMNQDPALDLPASTRSSAAANGSHVPAKGVTKSTMMRISARDVGAGHEAQDYAIAVIDIEGFGTRSAPIQKALRQQFYEVVDSAFDAQGILHRQAPHQDLGDGAFWLLPGSTSSALTASFITRLQAGLRDAAQVTDDDAVLRLRVALHSGTVERDQHGWVGADLTTACRLVDAQPLRDTLSAARRAYLALIISRRWHDDLARDGAAAPDGSAYQPVPVEIKELDDIAWIRVPGYASPPGLEGYPVPPSAGASYARPRPDDSTRKDPKPDPAAGTNSVTVLGGRHAFTAATVAAHQVNGGDGYEIHLPREPW